MNELARMHRALGEETRLRILNLLAAIGELCVCDAEAALGITQSKASRHLGVLKQAGLVADRRDGTWVYYRIRDDLDAPARAAIAALRRAAEGDESAERVVIEARRHRRSPICGPRGSERTP